MKKTKKEFTFDLNTEEMDKYFGKPKCTKGYDELERFFTKRNFEHRQGSVYCSKDTMYSHDVIDIVGELIVQCPWLKTCLRRMDVADIGELHELTDLITQD